MTDKKRSHTSRSSRSPSPEKNTERIGKKHAPDTKPKKKKRSRSSSSDSCTDSENDSSTSSVSIPSKHESKKKRKKLSKKKEKKKKKKSKKKLKKDKQKFKKVSAEMPTVEKTKSPVVKKIESTDETDRLLLDRAKAMAPMTKEEWEKRQSIIRKVYDEETGRYRLIKGDGEVLEEIVSRDRHREINKQATRGDGAFFQATIAAKLNK